MGQSRRAKQLIISIGIVLIPVLISSTKETGSSIFSDTERSLFEKETPSFLNDVFPIIHKKCWGSECHGPRNRMTHRYSNYDKIYSYRKTIKKRITAEKSPMPPADQDQLTEKEKQTLLDWIEAGAPNN